MTGVSILLVILVLVFLWVIATFNSLRTIKVRIGAGIQEIGNQLKRQANLIPNLEASVKGYLKHESSIFKQLTDARKSVSAAAESGSLEQAEAAAGEMAKLLPALKIAVEDNPELKADATVTKLMDELRDTSDKVMYSRRTLIDLTADFNQKLVTFPSMLIGKMFGMKTEQGLESPTSGEHLKVSAQETELPKVKLN